MVVPVTPLRPATARQSLGRSAGFSLIELTVVVAILSVLAISATLAVGRGGPERRRDGDTLAGLFRDLRQMAVQGQRALGLDLAASGWRRAEFDAASGGWRRPGTEIFWAGQVFVAVAPAERDTFGAALVAGAGAPTVVFLSDGRVTPVRVEIALAKGTLTCATDGFAPLACSEAQ